MTLRLPSASRRVVALLLAVGAVSAASLGTQPVGAAGNAVTFTLTGGSLSVSVGGDQTSVLTDGGGPFAILTDGVTVSGQLDPVTVEDRRGGVLQGWTAYAELTTAFSTGTDVDSSGTVEADETHTIPKASVTYDPGTPVAVAGLQLSVDSGALGSKVLDQKRAVVTGLGVVGSSGATWTPTLSVVIPADAPAGTYSGVVTHSMS